MLPAMILAALAVATAAIVIGCEPTTPT